LEDKSADKKNNLEPDEKVEDNNENKSFLRKNYLIIILITALSAYLIATLVILVFPNESVYEIWSDSQKYLKPLAEALPIIIAAIVILNVFYLGRVHDYNRDYIKQYAVFTEIKVKLEEKYESSETDSDKELIRDLKNDDEYYQEAENEFRNKSKWIILVTIAIVAGLLLSIIIFSSGSNTQNELFFLYISMIFGIFEFIIFWVANEKIISEHNDELKIITQDIAYLKTYLS